MAKTQKVFFANSGAEANKGAIKVARKYGHDKYDGKTVAIMIEIVQGEGGVLPLDITYLKSIQTLCDQRDILQYGDHGTTFGANPIACAGANVVMDFMNETFYEEIKTGMDVLEEVLTNWGK